MTFSVVTSPGQPPENWIDVFNGGRDANQPLVTLYDLEGVVMFFTMVCLSPIYLDYFDDSTIGAVSFNLSNNLQTGTGYYKIIPGGIQVISETGALVGLLALSDFQYLVKKGDAS